MVLHRIRFAPRRAAALPPVVCALVAFAAPVGVRAGETTLQAGSSPLSDNRSSAGFPLTRAFTFSLGTFVGGFSPGAGNTNDWSAHWLPVTDAAGQPQPAASVDYDDTPLGPPHPPGSHANHFAISVQLAHNNPPFTGAAGVYVWGYNRRSGGGNGEWILLTNPNWSWPDVGGGSVPSVVSYVVTDDGTTAVLGALQVDGVELRTAQVALPGVQSDYVIWLEAQFSAAELADPALAATLWGIAADPDGDGWQNGNEFYAGTNPQLRASNPFTLLIPDGDDMVLLFDRVKDASGVIGGAEWSMDLTTWTTDGLTETPLSDFGTRERIEARVPATGVPRVFLRVAVEEVPVE